MSDENRVNYHQGPQKVREDMRSSWEIKWNDPEYLPPWLTDKPPQELVKAVESGRFKKDHAILDIGCGLGSMSAWLIQQGCKVTGIDFSQGAIDRARKTYGGMNNLTFETVDMCGEFPEIGVFDGLFDRGCFHTIPLSLRPQYAKNISGLAKKNAPFLMIYKIRPSYRMSLEELQKYEANAIKNLFEPWFTLRVFRPTDIITQENTDRNSNWNMPAISIWMLRR